MGGSADARAPSPVGRLRLWLWLRCGMELRTVLALTVVLVAAAAFAVHHLWTSRPQPLAPPQAERRAVAGPPAAAVPQQLPGAAREESGAAGQAAGQIVVDVVGKVRRPGLQRLARGARVEDALTAAGGVRPGTDTGTLNRARLLTDGEQLVVGAAQPPGAAPGIPNQAAQPGAPLSLNTATAEQLDGLPGIGPVLAGHIVDYRAQHGAFTSLDQLREVNGIGPQRFAELKRLVTL
ncbi:helix-hairpin-helix domain-containing protein [Streptomyces polyrhachis]|uniref:Helix-hairpin-helix domain-containing protein n=1 Tax=Streptomyces polyrhachis TaxID=1282885 RepID=A0ABW2GLI9_9ACTN